MKIRAMRISDYDALRRLWLSCAGLGLNSLDDSRRGIERFLERNPETCFAAESESGGGLAGAILCGNDGRRAYIYHACVGKDFRRRGIGRTLVEAVVSALKDLGIAKVALVAFSSNASANAFWQKMGFSVRSDLTYRDKVLAEFERTDT